MSPLRGSCFARAIDRGLHPRLSVVTAARLREPLLTRRVSIQSGRDGKEGVNSVDALRAKKQSGWLVEPAPDCAPWEYSSLCLRWVKEVSAGGGRTFAKV
jgi:hypothetical protein